jgi:hypothetical protein
MIMSSKETKRFVYDPKVSAIHRLRVNIKSLAAEARIIRKEAKRAGLEYEMELTAHRRGSLREEARYAHLALAFVRGVPYKRVEAGALVPPLDTKLSVKLARNRVSHKPESVRAWLGL